MEVNVRVYHESDRETLKDITERTFRPFSIDAGIEDRFGMINQKNWAWRKRRHIDWDCDASPSGVFVAECDGRVVGYITTRVDRDSGVGWIPNLAVDVGQQGKGIGKKLMDTALDYLKREGMEGVRIETLAHNPVGTKFYPQEGFVEITRQVHYFMKF